MSDLAQLLVGGGLTLLGAFAAHCWDTKRQRTSRLESLFDEVVGQIVADEVLMQTHERGTPAPLEYQVKHLTLQHRLGIHAPQRVFDAYREYHTWVFKETAHRQPPPNPDGVVDARNRLRTAMREELQPKRSCFGPCRT